MAIEIRREVTNEPGQPNMIWAPKIVCDQCGRIITEEQKGSYAFQMSVRGKQESHRLWFVHKPQCLDALLRCPDQPGTWYWGWEPLADFMKQLERNLDPTDSPDYHIG